MHNHPGGNLEPSTADLFVVGGVLAASYGFYRLFERPFLNRSLPLSAPYTSRLLSADHMLVDCAY